MRKDVFYGAKKLGFGLMRLPLTDANNEKSIDTKQVCRMTDLFLERGFTYFDTAYMYHRYQSENAVKDFLTSRHPRDSFTLATKLHHDYVHSESDAQKVFDKQRTKTGVDFFDYYLLHDLRAEQYEDMKKFKVFEWLYRLKKSGAARHIGFSSHDGPDFLEQFLSEHPEMEFVQLQLNYIDYDSPFVQARKNYQVASRHGVPVIVMEPVKGGTLSHIPAEAEALFKGYRPDLSIASWAIRFAASLENVKMVLSGMSSVEQLEDNTGFMENFAPLNGEEQELIRSVLGIIQKSITIPCTGCSYCIDVCPRNIPIPKYFSLYNLEKQQNPEWKNTWTTERSYYDDLKKTFGAAKDCIECTQCEQICPQSLNIVKYLKDVSSRFD